MRRALGFICLDIAPAVPAATTAAPRGREAARATCAGAITWQHARSHVGRTRTVRGRVVATYYAATSDGQPTFLDLGRPYPSPSRFRVVIWQEDRADFGGRPELRFRGRTICVRGRIALYDGVPEIVARSSAQIAVAG
jgi:hypothetical protein